MPSTSVTTRTPPGRSKNVDLHAVGAPLRPGIGPAPETFGLVVLDDDAIVLLDDDAVAGLLDDTAFAAVLDVLLASLLHLLEALGGG